MCVLGGVSVYTPIHTHTRKRSLLLPSSTGLSALVCATYLWGPAAAVAASQGAGGLGSPVAVAGAIGAFTGLCDCMMFKQQQAYLVGQSHIVGIDSKHIKHVKYRRARGVQFDYLGHSPTSAGQLFSLPLCVCEFACVRVCARTQTTQSSHTSNSCTHKPCSTHTLHSNETGVYLSIHSPLPTHPQYKKGLHPAQVPEARRALPPGPLLL